MAFLRISLIIWGLLVTSEAGTCGTAWFGSKCQYKCRCTDNKCDDNGICIDGSKCSPGWFGPACQYADLAAGVQIKQSGSSVHYPKLTDGDEKTCADVSSFKSVTVDLTAPYPFTWMRIDLHRPDRNNGFEIQFKNKSDTDIILNCSNQKMYLISPETVDIHCDLDVAVDQVIVSWKNVESICSVYISGGRNVALKQKTSQSSTYPYPSNSSAAVDDELTWDSNNPTDCTHTDWEPSPHWNLYFTQPQVVNRYVLYNRNQVCCKVRLEGFILESFAKNGSLLLNHKDNQGVKDVYTVLSVDVKEPVSQVKITATNTDQMGDKSLLTLCEVQIYGECPTSYHGVDCLESCSNTCRNQSCDRVSGKCHGCIDGKQGEFCTEDCLKGKYGQDCKESCSEFCEGDGSCDPYNGTCTHGCKAGYQAAKCNETCVGGKYGKGCLSQCFWCQFIVINDYPVCNHMTGACNFGCLPAYKQKCESEDCTANSLGLQIGIGVTCTIILIPAVALVIVLFLFRKKNISKSDTREDDRPRDDEDDVLGGQAERPYANLNEDADGYCIPQVHHSPGFELEERCL